MITEHDVAPSCRGEQCRCGEPATHKLAEEIQDGTPRHPYTAYVCCRHFNEAVRPYMTTGYDSLCQLPHLPGPHFGQLPAAAQCSSAPGALGKGPPDSQEARALPQRAPGDVGPRLECRPARVAQRDALRARPAAVASVSKPTLGYDLRPCALSDVEGLVAKFHGYGSMGKYATYMFAVYEDGVPVAAYAWQPPPPGAARAVCPEAPWAVLALSRMVAVPKEARRLNHVSKPLRRQMLKLIDRGRWPVLVTYSDEGQGHTGYVYKCSGWEATSRTMRPYFHNDNGGRASSYANGKHGTRPLVRGGSTWMQRWEHWACGRGGAATHVLAAGWRRVVVPGRFWKSGAQAHTWVRAA